MQALLAQFDEKILEKEGLSEDTFLNVNRPEDWSLIQKNAQLTGCIIFYDRYLLSESSENASLFRPTQGPF